MDDSLHGSVRTPRPSAPGSSPAPARPRQGQAHEHSHNSKARVKSRRDADTTHPRVRVSKPKLARNRKHVNVPKLLLYWASGILAVEVAATLLFSPRFWVKRIVVEGNQNVAAQSLITRLGLKEHDNIVRLHMQKLREAVLAEPRIGTAEIHRSLPGTVRVVVTERAPWACAQAADGTCYIIDRTLVPFQTADIPPVGLPLLHLSAGTGKVTLGKTMTTPGLDQVSRCLAWAKSRPDFPLDAVSIDDEGKLCLNRAGGAKILLGSGRDLDKKLHSLETLLSQRTELRDTTRVASVNLFAYDAPAVTMRAASRATDTSGSDGYSAGNAGNAVDLPPSAAPPSVTKASP